MRFSLSPSALLLLATGFLSLLPACQKLQLPQEKPQPKPAPITDSLLRVTATIQYPDLLRPWLMKQPFTRSGLATVIEGGRLLVSADMVAHSTYIELEKPEDGPKATATIESIDQDCNLAVLKPVDASILKGTLPLRLNSGTRVGSKLDIVQLEQNGTPALSPATVTTIAVMTYPSDGAAYLLYRVATSIPQRADSFVIPALLDGNLAGLVIRYDAKTQAGDIIPAPLIERFLKESAKPSYKGLARAGLDWAQVRGANLGEWLGVGSEHNGIYVTSVEPNGPAEKAGLRKGDFLLKAANHPLDGEGNYLDPRYGKIAFNNLASLESAPGETMAITYFRSSGEGKGNTNTTTITLEGGRAFEQIVPSQLEGESIPYTFLGGLLFEELSLPYLMEWGKDWHREAPENLLYLAAFQNELPRDQGHLVVLSSIFPSAQSVGFQDLGKRVVSSINDREIHGLNDVVEAAKHPINGFHKIILKGSVGPIYLDAAVCPSEEESIRAKYGIPPQEKTPSPEN
jgi:S1-C subfamily serine protease